MEDAITIVANLSSKGFEAGTKAMKNALSSLSKSASQFGRTAGRSVNSVMSNIKRLAPMIIGVGSAYQILSKAVNAYMSQNEQLSKQMSAIWTSFGNLIGPIIERLVSWVTTAVSYLLSFLKVLGVTSKTASQLSKSSKQTGSDLKKTIAGFDELNTLSDNSGGGSGAGSLQDVEPTEWMNKLAELLKKGLWDDAATMIVDRFNELISIFAGKAAELGDKIGYYLGGIVHIIARIISDTDWHALGNAFAVMMNHIITQIDGRDIGKILVAKITIAIKAVTGFLEGIDARAWAELMTGIVTGALDALTTALEGANWQQIGSNIATLVQSIKWDEIAEAALDLLHSAFKAAFEMLWGLLAGEEQMPTNLLNALSSIKEALDHLLEAIGNFISFAWETLLKPMLGYSLTDGLPSLLELVSAGIEKIATFIEEHQPEILALLMTLGEVIAGFMLGKKISSLIDTISKLWLVVTKNPVAAIIMLILALIAYLVNLYMTNEEFRKKVDEVWAAVKETITTVVEWILEKWQALKDGITSVKDWIDEKVTGIQTTWTNFWNGLKETVKGWANGCIGMINSVINAINSFSHLSYGGLSVNLPFGGGTIDVIPGFDLQLFNIPNIPLLAKGGVLKKGQMGFLEGDGSEAVVPLEQNTEWISKIADGLVDRLDSGDYKIGQSLAALNDIADTVAYKIPAIAAGSVLPYSASDPRTGGSSWSGDSELAELLREFGDKIDEIIYLLDHVQFVAEFGDIRALARKIKKELRREQISEGT